MDQALPIELGADVVGSDGEKVGKVAALDAHYILVEKGVFFLTDYYIPRDAIAGAHGDKITLKVTKQEALDQGWDREPPAAAADTRGDGLTGIASAAEATTDIGATTGLGAMADLGSGETTIGDASPIVGRGRGGTTAE